MTELLFWEPYNKAKLYHDFRDLIEAVETDDPISRHPHVLKLLAEQVKNPKPPSRRTQARDGWQYAQEVFWLRDQHGISEYRAKKQVLSRYPDLNDETLKTYCRSYAKARKENSKIIVENQ